jgi:hypothetical protein
MIPTSLGGSIASIASGITLSKSGKYRVIMWTSYVVMTLGMGLMITLDYTSSEYVLHFQSLLLCSEIECSAEKEIFPLIASLGIGCLFQVPLVALQAAMPLKDMATASSGFLFLRSVSPSLWATSTFLT